VEELEPVVEVGVVAVADPSVSFVSFSLRAAGDLPILVVPVVEGVHQNHRLVAVEGVRRSHRLVEEEGHLVAAEEVHRIHRLVVVEEVHRIHLVAVEDHLVAVEDRLVAVEEDHRNHPLVVEEDGRRSCRRVVEEDRRIRPLAVEEEDHRSLLRPVEEGGRRTRHHPPDEEVLDPTVHHQEHLELAAGCHLHSAKRTQRPRNRYLARPNLIEEEQFAEAFGEDWIAFHFQ